MSALSPVLTNRTTSRTGSRPASAGIAARRRSGRGVDPAFSRARAEPGASCPAFSRARAEPGASCPAFTLIELMIVLLIVVILAALLIPALRAAKRSALKRQAEKEIRDIAGAVTSYFIDRNEYPPDTYDWEDWQGEEDEVDPRSIHRFLALTVEDSRGRTYGPYMSIKFGRLTDVLETEGKKVGIYTDPWDNPYHLDAVHTLMIDETIKCVGAPYVYDPNEPKNPLHTLDFKVASCGPDKETTPYYIFDPDVSDGVVRKMAKDDIRSW